MLHDRRERNREGTGELAYRDPGLGSQMRQQRAPCWIGERRKSPVEGFVAILYHVVKYPAESTRSQAELNRCC
jgi:hypothetical protein